MPTRDEFEVEIRFQAERLERKLREFAAECDKAPAEVLPQVMKSVIKDVMKLTPPLEKLSVTESWATQKKIGERAVQVDILSAFVPLDQLGFFKQPRDVVFGQYALKVLRSGGRRELADLLQRAGYRNVREDRIIEEPTVELHNPLRGSRGKVLSRGKGAYFVRKTTKVRKFVKEKQKLVGKLKAGWLRAADEFRVAVPAWVRRHRVPGGVENRSRAVMNPFIRAWNGVSYANRQNQDLRYVAIAMKNQVGKLERQIAARMRGAWDGRGAR